VLYPAPHGIANYGLGSLLSMAGQGNGLPGECLFLYRALASLVSARSFAGRWHPW